MQHQFGCVIIALYGAADQSSRLDSNKSARGAVHIFVAEPAAYSYKPVSGVHYPAVGYVKIDRTIPHSLLPPLQLMGRSSHLHAHSQLNDSQGTISSSIAEQFSMSLKRLG